MAANSLPRGYKIHRRKPTSSDPNKWWVEDLNGHGIHPGGNVGTAKSRDEAIDLAAWDNNGNDYVNPDPIEEEGD